MNFIFLKLKQLVQFLYEKEMDKQKNIIENRKKEMAALRPNPLPTKIEFIPSVCYTCDEVYELGTLNDKCVVCLEKTIVRKYEDESMEEFAQAVKLKKIIYIENN